MSIGTLFTLFAVPSIYVLLARDHRKAHAKDLEAERAAKAAGDAEGGKSGVGGVRTRARRLYAA